METDWMSHPCCLTCAIQPCLPLTWRLCRLMPPDHGAPYVSMLWLYWLLPAAILTRGRNVFLTSGSRLRRRELAAFFETFWKNKLGRVEFEAWSEDFHIPEPERYLFRLLFCLLLWQNCRRIFVMVLKGLSASKLRESGRPTHQWDHAILPAQTRMG